MGVRARRHKVEIMKREDTSTEVAGLDIGKYWLDLGRCSDDAHQRFPNTPEGIAQLLACLQAWQVRRVGLEASGNYERAVREALEAAGLSVVMFQPLQVRNFARWNRIRLKSDKADARLIALATRAQIAHRPGPDTGPDSGPDSGPNTPSYRDPEQADLAELLTVYEQISDLLATAKTQAEHDRHPEAKAIRAQVQMGLKQAKMRILAVLLAKVRQAPERIRRFDLLKSLPGVGIIVALVLLIRLPELGTLRAGKPAALLGVAPFDHDSGTLRGRRFISGGRARPRRFVYLAALVAKRLNTPFRTFAQRLAQNGKPPKVIVIAVARKLIEAANTVLKRQTPWTPQIT